MIKNWKTSLFGLSAILGGLATFFKGDVATAVTAIISGIGLLFAKDFNNGSN